MDNVLRRSRRHCRRLRRSEQAKENMLLIDKATFYYHARAFGERGEVFFMYLMQSIV